MVRLLADENVPIAVVEALRSYGHDVGTLAASLLGSGVPDTEILAMARLEGRVILTLNRRDFFRLHREQPDHQGIITCTFDPDFVGQAGRIHTALLATGVLQGSLLRVNRLPR